MQKLPMLFKRSGGKGYAAEEINPAAQWVTEIPTIPVRKWDGTCMMFDGEQWFSRRQVGFECRLDGIPNPDFIPVEYDENTRKTFGWEPVEKSSFIKLWRLAIEEKPYHCTLFDCDDDYEPGTYELIGPKVNGNPENLSQHRLMSHKESPIVANISVFEPHELTYNNLYNAFMSIPFEGVVFYSQDGRMAKLRRKDFDYSQNNHQPPSLH